MLATTASLMESPIARHSYGGVEHLPKPVRQPTRCV